MYKPPAMACWRPSLLPHFMGDTDKNVFPFSHERSVLYNKKKKQKIFVFKTGP